MDRQELLPRILIALLVAICCAFIFWMEGGLRWMETKVFPPRRPSFMSANSVWIDAPPLPLSWHHGWWFGCEAAASGTTNCRLVADGRTVYANEYLSCRTGRKVPQQEWVIVAPKDSGDMWLFAENAEGVAGFTKDGDILLPVTALSKCTAVQARMQKAR